MPDEITKEDEFKKEYDKCKTYSNWDELLKRTEIKLKIRIYKALSYTLKTVGGTMREESFVRVLGQFVKGLDEEDY